jgi:uncharacterized PurR-regulated membrane protein YhhQ (DUF165 family)
MAMLTLSEANSLMIPKDHSGSSTRVVSSGLYLFLLWRPTSLTYGNKYVLICIFVHFLTQCVLKPWWQWTYQNFTAKRDSARVVPWWVMSWKVWFGEPKAENIVSLGWVITLMAAFMFVFQFFVEPNLTKWSMCWLMNSHLNVYH